MSRASSPGILSAGIGGGGQESSEGMQLNGKWVSKNPHFFGDGPV